jgi:ribonuclease P protein component
MKKNFRIKKNEDFQVVFKKGKSFANRQFVIYIFDKPDQKQFRIGLSVSKKLGNAVLRNRVKRYIREVVKELKENISPNKDYIIIARKPAADMDFHQINASLQHVMKIAKVLRKKSEERK